MSLSRKHLLLIVIIVTLAVSYFLISFTVLQNTNKENVETLTEQINFHLKYTVTEVNGKSFIVFNSPDNYLLEHYRPMLPLYLKTLTLPENTTLLNISLKNYNLKSYENIEIDIMQPDKHFIQENVTYHDFYPEDVFWYNTYDLLDGKKKIEIIVSPIQYNNKTEKAKVYNDLEFIVEYL